MLNSVKSILNRLFAITNGRIFAESFKNTNT